MTPSARPERPPAEELAHRFAAEGFHVAVRPIAPGRYLAAATNAAVDDAGPVAMGDTAAEAVRLAWSRFEAHQDHYLAPLLAEPGGGTPLRRLRRARGLSQRRLATAAGVSVSTVNRLELDRRAVPSAATRAAIADALGVNACDVFPDRSRPLDSKELHARPASKRHPD